MPSNLKTSHKKSKGVLSFIAFLFSIFYIFTLSPSKLFTKNQVLVLHFQHSRPHHHRCGLGFHSLVRSSEGIDDKHEIHEEYVVMRRQRSVPSFPSSGYPEITKTVRLNEETVNKESREKTRAAHRRKLSIVHESAEHENPSSLKSQGKRLETRAVKNGEAVLRKKKVVVAKTFQRSKSEIVKRVVIDESKNIIRRIETEKHEPPDSDEDQNEYANMSNEELNRRVEEFIQRFNKQIRLQGEVYSRK